MMCVCVRVVDDGLCGNSMVDIPLLCQGIVCMTIVVGGDVSCITLQGVIQMVDRDAGVLYK